MTTDPVRRKKEWQRQYPKLHDWTILSRHKTKSAAQIAEKTAALARGCDYHPGGDGSEYANWCVYRFIYK